MLDRNLLPTPRWETIDKIVNSDVDKSLPRKGKNQSAVRRKLAKACMLEPLWIPKVIRMTVVTDDQTKQCKSFGSLPDGRIVSVRTHLPGYKARDCWEYPRMDGDVTSPDQRVGLFQRMLHHAATWGLSKSQFHILNRMCLVGFRIPIKHLRKAVHKVTLCDTVCKKDLATLGRPRKRSYQYPVLLQDETKSIRKYGITVPLWKLKGT